MRLTFGWHIDEVTGLVVASCLRYGEDCSFRRRGDEARSHTIVSELRSRHTF